jgi:hypothetical protein
VPVAKKLVKKLPKEARVKGDYTVGRGKPPKHTQFKPGQPSANPLGGQLHDPVKKALKRLTVGEFQDVIHLALTSDLAGLQAVAKDPKSSALKVGVATSLAKAIQKGDWATLESISARIVGRVAAKVELTGADGGPIRNEHAAMTRDERLAEIEKLDKLRKEAGED